MNSARLPHPGCRVGLAAGFLGLLLVLAPRVVAQIPMPIREVQAMLRAPGGSEPPGHPVQIKGVVLFHEPAEKLLVVGDETGSVLVETTGRELGLAPGQAVSVQGLTGSTLGRPAMVQGAVSTRAGHQKLTPKPAEMDDALAGRLDYEFVSLEGLVTTVSATRGRILLHLHHGESHLNAAVRDLRFDESASARFLGARVRMRGVVVPYRNKRDVGEDRTMLAIQSQEDIEILSPGGPPDFDVPATPIDHVPPITSECRIRIAGQVTAPMTNRVMQVRDETGEIRLHLDHWVTVRKGDHLEVLGYPTRMGTVSLLDHCTVRILAPRQAPTPPGPLGPPPLAPVVRSVNEVLELKAEPDSEGLPVRFQATITGCAPHLNTVYLLGPSNALRAVLAANARRASTFKQGQIVEVTGYTAAGGFIPHLVEARLAPRAQGSLPLPRELPYDALASGQHDSERIAIQGIVRTVRTEGPVHILDVAAGGGRFPVLLPAGPSNAAPTHLIDAQVRVHGICSVVPNQRRQASGFRIHAADLASLQVERPAPPDPFQIGTDFIADLFRPNQSRAPGHRTKIRGTVTVQDQARSFYLRGRTASIRVEHADPMNLQSGDVVEVVGFPVLKESQLRIEDAILRVTGRTNTPVPKPLLAGTVLTCLTNADEWISLEGRLLEVRRGPGVTTLALESDQLFFEARFPHEPTAPNLHELERGALMRIAGICQFKYDEHGQPRSFSLLAATPDALTVLRPGPWLTTRQAGAVLGSLLGIALAALAWVTLLRRTVQKQTKVIRDLNSNLERRVAERTAELEAANRELESFSYSVSHDLRAPLRAVNGFAEVLLKTHGAQLDERGSRYLHQVAEGGRRMGRLVDDLLTFSRLGRQSLGRTQVDLQLLARRVFEELQRQHPQRQVEFRLQSLPPALGDRPLLEQVLTNLIGNAWKFTAHQNAALIEVGAVTHGGQPVYFVRDNGAGFDMKYADKLFGVFQRLHPEDEFPGTGVGLAIVQRIIHRHGGHIWTEASPGKGATFFFTLPAGAPAAEPAQAFGK